MYDSRNINSTNQVRPSTHQTRPIVLRPLKNEVIVSNAPRMRLSQNLDKDRFSEGLINPTMKALIIGNRDSDNNMVIVVR